MEGIESNFIAPFGSEMFLPFMGFLKGLLIVPFQQKKDAALSWSAVECLGRCLS